jgi:hypothetical protein
VGFQFGNEKSHRSPDGLVLLKAGWLFIPSAGRMPGRIEVVNGLGIGSRIAFGSIASRVCQDDGRRDALLQFFHAEFYFCVHTFAYVVCSPAVFVRGEMNQPMIPSVHPSKQSLLIVSGIVSGNFVRVTVARGMCRVP